MEEDLESGKSSGNCRNVTTIPSKKPTVGTVRMMPSRTQVFLGSKMQYQGVCNYVFSVAG